MARAAGCSSGASTTARGAFQLTYPNGDQAHVVGVTFLAGRVAGAAVADGEEGSELGWFSPEQLPALSGYNGLLTARARALLSSGAVVQGPGVAPGRP
ncbi:hypothetical protein GCM10009687_30420 [Asanoa iriomotensis]|uniref:NUDIX domain-containing protein n=1 Tax=Asanoa iriomotensis TaxID=234613 RepID=A0ABQ4CG07_9ACTN|nr:hypothetical protein Air01nite_77740 [Asanoa iriomotensis]